MKDELPVCIQSSPEGVIRYGDFEEDKEKNIYAVAKNVLVKAEHWKRNGVMPNK
jgi:Fe-S-cluster-containing dehydrogenase component